MDLGKTAAGRARFGIRAVLFTTGERFLVFDRVAEEFLGDGVGDFAFRTEDDARAHVLERFGTETTIDLVMGAA